MKTKLIAIALGMVAFNSAQAAFIEYGDEDVLGTGTYGSDPKTGATLNGLAPNAVTYGTLITGHGFPFDPSSGDFAGTDQIYVGSVQTSNHDGYSGHGGRLNGPQMFDLDYSSLVPAGHMVTSLTLGIAADDFQNAVFQQPYLAKINGANAPTLTNTLNAFNQTGPVTQFFTIGVDPLGLSATHHLSISIDQLGDGGDGWAVDFLTIGVETAPVPEPGSLLVLGLGAVALLKRKR